MASELEFSVAEVLEDQDIAVGDHDVVQPSLDTEVSDGARIAVLFGRPLDVNLDGEQTRHWVTARDVTTALSQIGLRVGGANLSVSRGADITRNGMSLTIATPKKLTLAIAGEKPVKRTVAALTVAQATIGEERAVVDGAHDRGEAAAQVIEPEVAEAVLEHDGA